MYFVFGNHTHPANEVNVASLSQRVLRGPRNIAYATRKTMAIEGELLQNTQATMKTAIQQLEAAYTSDGSKSAALYHDDGTLSPHALDASATTTGVKVEQLDYPKSDGSEYATKRSFRIVLEADFPVTGGAGNLLVWNEQIRITGTGGPSFILIPTLTGPPQKQIVNQRTPVTAVQSGQAVGYLSRPTPPPPLWPRDENLDRRDISLTAPRLDGNQFVEWGVSWSYQFSSIGPLAGEPNRR